MTDKPNVENPLDHKDDTIKQQPDEDGRSQFSSILRKNSVTRSILIPSYALLLVTVFPIWMITSFVELPFSKIKLSTSMLDLINDMPIAFLAVVMGMAGAAIKHTTLKMDLREASLKDGVDNPRKSTPVLSIFTFVFVGGGMGVFSFLFVKSRVIGALLYNGEGLSSGTVSAHGIALFAAGAGYFSFELLGYAKDRLTHFTSTQKKSTDSNT